MLANTANAIQGQDPLLASALLNLRGSSGLFPAAGVRGIPSGLAFLLDFRGSTTNPSVFSTAAARNFFQKIQNFSKLSATQAMPEEEVFVTKDMFSNAANANTFAQNVKEQSKAKFRSSLPPQADNFCKVKTSGSFVYLFARPVPPGFEGTTSNDLRTAGSIELANGNKAEFVDVINAFALTNPGVNDIAYIVSQSCEPLESGEDALARKSHILGSGPIDALIRGFLSRLGRQAEINRMETSGLNKNERDFYVTVQIVLHWASGSLKSANLAATMLLDSPTPTDLLLAALFTLSTQNPAQSATTTFATHGPLKGGEDIEGGEDEGIEGGLCSGAGSFECLDVLLCDLCLDHIGIGCADL
jgi:hypothetical protein